MHVSTKEVDEGGVHTLTNLVEADGPFALASPNAKLDARVAEIRRTESGGIEVKTQFMISEPVAAVAAVPAPEPTADDLALAYLKEKGLGDDDAKAALGKFGTSAILAKQADERSAELNNLLGPKPDAQ